MPMSMVGIRKLNGLHVMSNVKYAAIEDGQLTGWPAG